MLKVTDFKSLAPHCCKLPTHQQIRVYYVRKPFSNLSGTWWIFKTKKIKLTYHRFLQCTVWTSMTFYVVVRPTSEARWQDDENTMVRWWNRDGIQWWKRVPFGQAWPFISSLPVLYDDTIMKTLWYDDKTRWRDKAKMRWWNHDGTMVKSRWYIAFLRCFVWTSVTVPCVVPRDARWHEGKNVMVYAGENVFRSVNLHHRTIVFSPSYNRVFISVSSCIMKFFRVFELYAELWHKWKCKSL